MMWVSGTSSFRRTVTAAPTGPMRRPPGRTTASGRVSFSRRCSRAPASAVMGSGSFGTPNFNEPRRSAHVAEGEDASDRPAAAALRQGHALEAAAGAQLDPVGRLHHLGGLDVGEAAHVFARVG